MGIEELHKPPLQRCVHQATGHCRIYSTRPPSCRDFNCLWKLGCLPKHERPDKVGAVAFIEADQPDIVRIQAYERSSAERAAKLVELSGWTGPIELITEQPGGDEPTSMAT